jgi:hypothetical protein
MVDVVDSKGFGLVRLKVLQFFAIYSTNFTFSKPKEMKSVIVCPNLNP